MKKYQVMEAHQGDKFYKPGDPETGTRIADPNSVDHLVRLGALMEIGDADEAPPPPADDAATIADLRDQVAALGNDRDAMREQIGTLTQERDAAGQEAATTIADLQGQVSTLTDGLEAMRGEVAALAQRFAEAPATGTDEQSQAADPAQVEEPAQAEETARTTRRSRTGD
ncbi:hypothetical protein DMC47_21455 [Nostoc sp. 3335mG]|nr:hypothetical protein DMC47_21455 [Nostoc sp. 3335mG]